MRIFDVLKNAIKKIDNNVSVENITNKEIDTLFGSASGTGTDAQDYVIEHGVNSNWKYRKWASGVCEAWNADTQSKEPYTTPFTGAKGYYKDIPLPSGLFTAVEIVVYNCQVGGGTTYPACILSNSTTNIRVYATMTTTTTTAQSFISHTYVKGAWK